MSRRESDHANIESTHIFDKTSYDYCAESNKPFRRIRIITVSDTHLRHKFKLWDADILIHAGDLTGAGTFGELTKARNWLRNLPYYRKLVLGGNHDRYLDSKSEKAEQILLNHDVPELAEAPPMRNNNSQLIYIKDSSTTQLGIHFYGTPWTPKYGRWAFQLENDEIAESIFSKIPSDIDFLICHGPPCGIRDNTRTGVNAGSPAMYRELPRIRAGYFIFGHIHESYGTQILDLTLAHNPQHSGPHNILEKSYDDWMKEHPPETSFKRPVRSETLCINTSICNLMYAPRHRPWVVDYFVLEEDIDSIEFLGKWSKDVENLKPIHELTELEYEHWNIKSLILNDGSTNATETSSSSSISSMDIESTKLPEISPLGPPIEKD